MIRKIVPGVSAVAYFTLSLIGVCETAPQSKPLPPGDLRAETGFYSLVFYYAPDPATEVRALAEKLVQEYLPGVPISTDATNPPRAPFVGFLEEMAPLKTYPVPDAGYFEHAGHGLSAKDAETMQKTSRATRLVFVMPKDDAWAKGRSFSELAFEFARQSGAYIWDSATRECFSTVAWKERRVDSWPAKGIPEIPNQITIHLYRPDDSSPYLRAITLGMEKFALPDVVIDQLTRSDSASSGSVINLVCQSLAERPKLTSGTREIFRIPDISSKSVRDRLSQDLKSGAKLEIPLALVEGRELEGDPKNHLVELDFRHGEGRTVAEKRNSLLSALWGATDSVQDTTHTPEVLAASARAKARLPELAKLFVAGLPPGSRLMLKAPFKRDDNGGNEWMWVEVMRWPESGPVEGILKNDPFYISALRAGARVEVKAADIFDYLFYRKDGSREGNETGDLISKQSGRVREK